MRARSSNSTWPTSSQIVSTYLADVETAGQAGGLEPADIEAEIAIGLRQLRDELLVGQQARRGSAAVAVGEIVVRIGALTQGLARRAMARVLEPAAPQYGAVRAAPGSPWLQVDLPMRPRVWSALTEIRQARRARAAGVATRLGRIRNDFAPLKKLHTSRPADYEFKVKPLYGRLRDSYERLVEEHIFRDVVRRGVDRIETQKLRMVHLSDALAMRFHDGFHKLDRR